MTLLKPAQKRGKKFLNPVPTAVGGLRTILKALPQLLNNKQEREPRHPLGPFATDAAAYATEPSSGLRVTWFGHSSSLIEMDGVRILVDPVWDVRASPFQWMGPKRFYAPTLAIEALPRIDVVLISHDHYDHLGAGTVRRLARAEATAGARWVTALGVGRLLHGLGVAAASVVELDWTESTEVDGLRVTMWPSRHFSGRSLFNRDQTLWGAFVLEGQGHRVYYGADTGPWEGFAEIAAQYGGFDLTMLEIGASSPLWPDIHLGPDAAAAAFAAMGGGERAGLLMPIHWGLFNLALHAWRDPVERMLTLAEEQGMPLWLPRPGEPTEVVRGTALRSDWWV
jgi:L-ascorbate metabolism protein UlaG (beta-lactamase superfamily)